MGFDVSDEIEDTNISKGAVVDAVWKLRIGNFGEIRYVFKLQLKGNIDPLILNLMWAGRNPAVRGLAVVTDARQIKQITKEIEGLPEDFKSRLRFLTIDDLNKVYENLTALSAFRNKLGLQI